VNTNSLNFPSGVRTAVAEAPAAVDTEELDCLRLQLQQRDHEINILVSMLNEGACLDS